MLESEEDLKSLADVIKKGRGLRVSLLPLSRRHSSTRRVLPT